MTTCSWPFVKL